MSSVNNPVLGLQFLLGVVNCFSYFLNMLSFYF